MLRRVQENHFVSGCAICITEQTVAHGFFIHVCSEQLTSVRFVHSVKKVVQLCRYVCRHAYRSGIVIVHLHEVQSVAIMRHPFTTVISNKARASTTSSPKDSVRTVNMILSRSDTRRVYRMSTFSPAATLSPESTRLQSTEHSLRSERHAVQRCNLVPLVCKF